MPVECGCNPRRCLPLQISRDCAQAVRRHRVTETVEEHLGIEAGAFRLLAQAVHQLVGTIGKLPGVLRLRTQLRRVSTIQHAGETHTDGVGCPITAARPWRSSALGALEKQ